MEWLFECSGGCFCAACPALVWWKWPWTQSQTGFLRHSLLQAGWRPPVAPLRVFAMLKYMVCLLTSLPSYTGSSGGHSFICVFIEQNFKNFKLNFLGSHWLIALYKFQGCSSIKCHLCVALCTPHPKSSLLPASHI